MTCPEQRGWLVRCLCTAKQLLANAAYGWIGSWLCPPLAVIGMSQGSEGVGGRVVCRREKSPQYFVITPKLVRSPRRHTTARLHDSR